MLDSYYTNFILQTLLNDQTWIYQCKFKIFIIFLMFTIFVVKLFESYHYFFLCFRQSFRSNWMMSMSRSPSCQYCQETNDISSTYTLKSFRMLKWHVKTTQQSTSWLKKNGKSSVIYLVILNTRYNLCYTFIFSTIMWLLIMRAVFHKTLQREQKME